jgi:hypothetical protein
MKTKLKNLWWLIINKKYPINYEIYRLYEKFYFKVLIYRPRGKALELIIDLCCHYQVENLKNDKDYLKIQEEIKSWGNNQIMLNTIKEFNLIIKYIIKNF